MSLSGPQAGQACLGSSSSTRLFSIKWTESDNGKRLSLPRVASVAVMAQRPTVMTTSDLRCRDEVIASGLIALLQQETSNSLSSLSPPRPAKRVSYGKCDNQPLVCMIMFDTLSFAVRVGCGFSSKGVVAP